MFLVRELGYLQVFILLGTFGQGLREDLDTFQGGIGYFEGGIFTMSISSPNHLSKSSQSMKFIIPINKVMKLLR